MSPRGREQAAELPKRLADVPFDRVFCSALRRAIETAQIAFSATREIHFDPRLNEVDYGDYTGMPVRELDALRTAHIDGPFPNGESYRQRVAQVDDFLKSVLRERPIDPFLVIGCRGTKWSLDVLLDHQALVDVVTRPFVWRPFWQYRLD